MSVAVRQIVSSGQWAADPAAESLFEHLGVNYEYVANVAITLIDRELSLQNQARLGVKLDDDVVEEYSAAMAAGAVFPALVAFPLPNGTYLLAGGNHRLEAARRAKRKLIDLYLLRVADEAMRRLITTSLNTKNGVRPGRSETVEQAIAWMERFGRTPKSAAAHFSLPESALTRELKTRSTRRRLQIAGVDPNGMSRSVIERMSTIQNDTVLTDVADFVKTYGVGEPIIRQLTADIRSQRTEAGQLGVVQSWRDRDDMKLRKVEGRDAKADATQKARAELFRCLNSALKLLERRGTRGQLGLTNDDDYTRAVNIAYQLVAKIEGVDGGASTR